MSLTYTADGITITYLGRTAFAESALPLQSESQSGLDNLQRTYTGAAPLLAAFLAGLNKGGTYVYNSDNYYLIDWAPNGDKLWPEVTLNYIGQSRGNIPPIGDDDWSPQSITTSAILNVAVPDPDSDPPGQTVHIDVTAERQIEYLAFQTTWHYIASARPTGMLVGTVSQLINPIILRSRITTSSNSSLNPYQEVYAGQNAPAELVAATTPGVDDVLLNLAAAQVYPTPFFDVQETIGLLFVG